HDALSLLSNLSVEKFDRLRQIKREDTDVVMTFASAINKTRYDRLHKSIASMIQSSTMIYLRFYQSYTILELANRKLSQQRVESFKILEAVEKERQTFRLKLSSIMKIHSVIFITQLELVVKDKDSYNRFTNDNVEVVVDKYIDTEASSYEIERLLVKRIIRDKLYYLIK
ncbi:MAG: hypothetical protein Q9191_007813, partial [Dirinaria sp. TL-2023a]